MSVVPILMYHNIGDPPPGVALPCLFTPRARFRQQMRWLKRLGYRGVSMSEALAYLRGTRRGRAVAITFDDGYADVLESAAPILAELGFRATCYVVSARIGGYNDWDAEQLGVRKRVMDRAQLGEWRACGLEIGAHTRTHPHLRTCSAAQLDDEIRGGKQELEDLLGEAVTQFCYPYGETGAAPDVVRAAGFQAATTTQRGRARSDDDWLRLPRVHVKGHKPAVLVPFRVITSYEDRRR